MIRRWGFQSWFCMVFVGPANELRLERAHDKLRLRSRRSKVRDADYAAGYGTDLAAQYGGFGDPKHELREFQQWRESLDHEAADWLRTWAAPGEKTDLAAVQTSQRLVEWIWFHAVKSVLLGISTATLVIARSPTGRQQNPRLRCATARQFKKWVK